MEFYISENKEKFPVDRAVELLHKTYWAEKRSEEKIRTSIENSIVYGAYEKGTGRLVGMARLVTDYATIFYLADVVVDEECRGDGIGKELVKTTLSDERIKGIKGFLFTRDAHGLYEKYGFKRETVRSMEKAPQ